MKIYTYSDFHRGIACSVLIYKTKKISCDGDKYTALIIVDHADICYWEASCSIKDVKDLKDVEDLKKL